jgi:tetratricopeptide (TPR) repeat protein
LAALVLGENGRRGSAGFGEGVSAWQYAATQAGVVVHYLRLCFWPSPLVFDYGDELATTAGQVVPYAIIIGVLLVATGFALVWRPALGFLGVCFFALLAPSSSFVPIVTQTAAEHRMYLPLAAVVVVFVLAAFAIRQRLPLSDVKAVPMLLVTALVTLLGYQTFLRNRDYRAELSIWEDTLEKRPDNPRPYVALGIMAFQRNNLVLARRDIDKAISLKPDYAQAYSSRGAIFLRVADFQKAEADFAEAMRLSPKTAFYAYQRGLARWSLGRVREAIGDYTRSLELDPTSADAYFQRGNAYRQLADMAQAIVDYTQALKQESGFAEAYTGRAAAYAKQGQLNQAVADCTQALAIWPRYADAYRLRARYRFQMGDVNGARADVATLDGLGAAVNPKFREELQEAPARHPKAPE